MKFHKLLFAALLALVVSCGGKDEGDDVSSALAVPANVKLHSASGNTMTFQWNAVTNATAYDWKLLLNGDIALSGTESKRNATVSPVNEGVKYQFQVRATKGDTASDWSEAIDAIIGEEITPAEPGDGSICVDAPLVLEFSSDATLGTEGYLKVFKSDGTQVDEINLADASTVTIREDGIAIPKEQITTATLMNTYMDAVRCGSRYRILHYTPLRLDAGKLTVKLHSGVLDFNTEYYLTMDAGFIKGDAGSAAKQYTFKTGNKPSSTTELNVKADGTGDFCTVQRAVDYAVSTLGKTAEVTINVAEGTYEEMVFIREKNNLTIKGASRDKTIIQYPNNESYEGGSGGSTDSKPAIGKAIGKSGGRGMILAENCDYLVIKDLTMKNSFGSLKGQAEAIYFNAGDSYHMNIDNCALYSLQDTFLCKGTVKVSNSLIAGHCDFIWGYPKECIFENCEIRAEAAGYVVQARVQNASNRGFIFRNCKFTASEGVKDGTMYLARSAGQSDCYDNITLVNCTLGSVIATGGWYTSPAPNPEVPTATSGWKEYGSVDVNGKAVTGHNSYGKYLTADEAAAYLTD